MPDEELEKYMAMWDKMRADGVGPVPLEELPSHMRSQLHGLQPRPESSSGEETPPPGSNGVIKG